MTLWKHEMRQNLKSILIWSLSVGGIGLICILLYTSMTEDMAALSESFSNMGAFSDAFGMSTLGIGTIAGFFSTEVGVVHSLGSAMFAAILAISVLSKEEDGHTGEFLYSLPVSRGGVITAKACSVVSALLLFTIITGCLYVLGLVCIGEHLETDLFLKFLASQLLMNLEIAALCMAVSAFSRKNRIGTGIGIALLLYVFDLTGRVIPDLKDWIVLGPFSFANASDLFAGKEIAAASYLLGIAVIAGSLACAFGKYRKKDLAS